MYESAGFSRAHEGAVELTYGLRKRVKWRFTLAQPQLLSDLRYYFSLMAKMLYLAAGLAAAALWSFGQDDQGAPRPVEEDGAGPPPAAGRFRCAACSAGDA